MYKISQTASALPRTAIPGFSLQKSMVLNSSSKSRHPKLCINSHITASTPDEKLRNSVKSFDISKTAIWADKASKSSPYENIPPQKPVDPEVIRTLDNAWQNFLTDENGLPDEKIVTYSESESVPVPNGFVPLDVDKFMEKRILAALDLDILN